MTLESGNDDGKEVVTGSEVSEETKAKALSAFLTGMDYEVKTLYSTQELLARQKSLNTVYQRSLSYHSSATDRKKAIVYRNTIAKANVDYDTLKTLWTVSFCLKNFYFTLLCLPRKCGCFTNEWTDFYLLACNHIFLVNEMNG